MLPQLPTTPSNAVLTYASSYPFIRDGLEQHLKWGITAGSFPCALHLSLRCDPPTASVRITSSGRVSVHLGSDSLLAALGMRTRGAGPHIQLSLEHVAPDGNCLAECLARLAPGAPSQQVLRAALAHSTKLAEMAESLANLDHQSIVEAFGSKVGPATYRLSTLADGEFLGEAHMRCFVETYATALILVELVSDAGEVEEETLQELLRSSGRGKASVTVLHPDDPTVGQFHSNLFVQTKPFL